MAVLLKKVWESVSVRSNSNSGISNQGAQARASMGVFDEIPDEILMVIVRLLGPKEAAKLCVACKTWKEMISDNRLWIHFFQSDKDEPYWESVFFSEIHLRSGYPLQAAYDENPQVSFMDIYGQRVKVPGAVIVDGGSGYCKFGWSKYHRPSGRSATFLEFGNIEASVYTRLRHFYGTIYRRMQVKPPTQPVVVSIPICHYDYTESAKASRRQLKEAIYSALFDMNVPAVCAINQAILALYAARRTSGIVVNIGFHQTSVVPILQGKVMCKVGVEVVGMGALKLTGFLREQMQQRNIHFESLYTVRELKENLCYVALDYEAELRRDKQATYEVSREGVFTLLKECFQTGEILFQPRIAGVRAMALHQAVALCMDHCHAAELMGGDDSWFKTVVQSGGTACLPGLAERLEKELRGLFPPSMSKGIRVIPPQHGIDSAWHGARLISNLSTFPRAWCITKKQFRQKSRRNLIGGAWS